MSARLSTITDSPALFPSVDPLDAFRKLYFHLYTNSNSSRAERIISDLSKLLLVKILEKKKKNRQAIQDFLDKEIPANSSIFPLLSAEFSGLLDEQDKFSLDEPALRYGYRAIQAINLEDAPAHVVGDAFQALIGPRLRGDKGQFFTPKTVVRAIVEILSPSEDCIVIDPACGTGGFLIETALQWKESRVKGGQLVGADKDGDLSLLASAMLGLVANAGSHIYHTNSLDLQSKENHLRKYIGKADFVLTNPPFGTKIAVTEKQILAQYDLGHVWKFDEQHETWLRTEKIDTSQDPQILFVDLCVQLLKPGGKMGIVLPEGLFGNKTTGFVLDFLRSKGRIFALIDCPRTTFQPGTDTKTNILFFEKATQNTAICDDSEDVMIAVALNCGHDRRGRSIRATGEPYPDDFKTIAQQFNSSESDFWSKCRITNPFYLVPRYYDAKSQLLLLKDASNYDAELISLGEMIKKGWINIRKGDEVGAEAYGTGEYPFIRTSDISNFEISIDPTRGISEDIYEKYAAIQKLRPGDILMVVDGRYRIGRCAILHETNYKCVVQSHLKIISVTEKAPFKPIELLLLLSLPSVQREIRSLIFIQSTLGSIGRRLNELKVPVPRSSKNWHKQIEQFSALVNARANSLAQLQEFEAALPEL